MMAAICGSVCSVFMIHIYQILVGGVEEGRKKKVQAKSVFDLKIMLVHY